MSRTSQSSTQSSATRDRTPSDVRRRNLMRVAAGPQEQIARRAYELYLARGATHGRDLDDWLQAERELSLSRH